MTAVRSVLTLADLERYDPRALERGGRRRFCCPLPDCSAKPVDAAHRTLSVDPATGLWKCHRCGGGGQLREWWAPLRARPLTRRQRSLATRRALGLQRVVEASTRSESPGVRGGVGPVPGRTGAHSASPPAVEAPRAAAEAPVGPAGVASAPEGAGLDPRPDLAVDAPLWAVLLRLSAALDGEDPAGVHGALLGARTMGGRLEVGGRTLCLLLPEGVDAVEWARVGDDQVAAPAGPLRTLLWRAWRAWREVGRGVAA